MERAPRRDKWPDASGGGAGRGVYYSEVYHPLQAGSIDGTDLAPHDRAVKRALVVHRNGLYKPLSDPKATGDPHLTLFVGRLPEATIEAEIRQEFEPFGAVQAVRLVRDIVTGASRRYAFVEFARDRDVDAAFRRWSGPWLVDFYRQGLMPGWIPRRMGGGLSGKKESGQLRFGGRDRPFHAPLRPVNREEMLKLGIPLPPEGRFFSRHQTPPRPKRARTEPDSQEPRQASPGMECSSKPWGQGPSPRLDGDSESRRKGGSNERDERRNRRPRGDADADGRRRVTGGPTPGDGVTARELGNRSTGRRHASVDVDMEPSRHVDDRVGRPTHDRRSLGSGSGTDERLRRPHRRDSSEGKSQATDSSRWAGGREKARSPSSRDSRRSSRRHAGHRERREGDDRWELEEPGEHDYRGGKR